MAIQVIINGLVTGLLYSLVALGFSLIYSGTRVFHIAHGAIYTAGTYLLLAWLGATATILSGSNAFSLATAITLSLVSVCLLVVFVELFVYRPLFKRKAPTLVSFISSLGLYIVIVNLIALLFGNETKILNPDIEPSIEIAGAIITRIQIIQFVVSALLILTTLLVLRSSSLGRNIRALSDNPTLLSVLGTNIKSVRLLVFVIGSLLAVASSLLRAFDVGVDPHVGLSAVLTAAVAVIIAGVGSHLGAIVGALLIGMTQNIVVWFTSAQWQDAVTFVILTIVLLVRREGLFATQLRLEER